MPEVNINICEELKAHLIMKMSVDPSTLNAIDYLIEIGVLDKKRVLLMLIKLRYSQLRKKHSHRSAALDVAIEFGVDSRTVENAVYKYKHIKV